MSEYNRFADQVADTLRAQPAPTSMSTAALAVVNKDNGRLAAYADKTGQLIQPYNLNRRVVEDFASLGSTDQVALLTPGGLARVTTTAVINHMFTPNGNIFAVANIGTQSTAPAVVAAGLDIRGDATQADGTELFTNFALATGRPFCAQRDAGFFFRVTIALDDVSGVGVLLAGFRRAEVNNVTYTSYADYAAIGLITTDGNINIAQEINAAGTAPTDTTNDWADTETKTLEIRVSGAGVVSYLINGVAPTVTAAQTFDPGDPLIPFVHFIQETDIAVPVITSWEVGHQV